MTLTGLLRSPWVSDCIHLSCVCKGQMNSRVEVRTPLLISQVSLMVLKSKKVQNSSHGVRRSKDAVGIVLHGHGTLPGPLGP